MDNKVLEMGKDINNIEKIISNFISEYENLLDTNQIDELIFIKNEIRLINAELERKFFQELIIMCNKKIIKHPHKIFLGGDS